MLATIVERAVSDITNTEGYAQGKQDSKAKKQYNPPVVKTGDLEERINRIAYDIGWRDAWR